MEEKYQEYKKSKTYKKHMIINVFLVILFLSIVSLIVYFYYASSDKNEVKPNKNYFYEIKNNVVYLNSIDGLEASYKCQDACEIYTRGELQGYFNKGKILLKDGIYVYLYDLLNSKKLGSSYNWVDYIYDGEGYELDNIKMFKVKDSLNKHGVIDLNGNPTIPVIYDELGKIQDEELLNYSYTKNHITAKSGDKWGLLALTNGKGLIDFQYSDIILSPYGKLAVKEGDLWSLVDESNKRILNKGYSSINIHEDYIVVSEENKAFIVDILGNVTSNKIEIFYKVDPWATITIKGLSTQEEDGIIYIFVDVPLNETAGTYKTLKYYYDEENNEIKNVE